MVNCNCDCCESKDYRVHYFHKGAVWQLCKKCADTIFNDMIAFTDREKVYNHLKSGGATLNMDNMCQCCNTFEFLFYYIFEEHIWELCQRCRNLIFNNDMSFEHRLKVYNDLKSRTGR